MTTTGTPCPPNDDGAQWEADHPGGVISAEEMESMDRYAYEACRDEGCHQASRRHGGARGVGVMGAQKRVSDAQIDAAARRVADGAYMEEVAAECGISSRMLRLRFRAAGVPPGLPGRPRLPEAVRLNHCPSCRCRGRIQP